MKKIIIFSLICFSESLFASSWKTIDTKNMQITNTQASQAESLNKAHTNPEVRSTSGSFLQTAKKTAGSLAHTAGSIAHKAINILHLNDHDTYGTIRITTQTDFIPYIQILDEKLNLLAAGTAEKNTSDEERWKTILDPEDISGKLFIVIYNAARMLDAHNFNKKDGKNKPIGPISISSGLKAIFKIDAQENRNYIHLSLESIGGNNKLIPTHNHLTEHHNISSKNIHIITREDIPKNFTLKPIRTIGKE